MGYDLSRPQDVANLLHELRQARTLHIEFIQGELGSLETSQQEQKLVQIIRDAVWVQWGAWYRNGQIACLKQCLDEIGIPVFIVFDEIGSAFLNERDAFNEFVDCIGSGLLSHPQLYYVLSGRVDFSGVGPERSSIMVNPGRPGIYERIQLRMSETEFPRFSSE